jgi:hypothetical protein
VKRRNVKVGQRIEHKFTGAEGEIIEVNEDHLFSVGVRWDDAPKPILYYKPKGLRRLPGKTKRKKGR